MIIAVDFDGTICKNAWPQIGEPNFKLIHWLKEQRGKGHTLILWTCREGELLQEALRFCEIYGLVFDYVNENSQDVVERFGCISRKVYADLYIDDKSLCPSDIKVNVPTDKTSGFKRQKMSRL